MKALKRIYYHCLRFRGEFLFATILSVIFFLFFGGFYPEDDITEFVDVLQSAGIFGHLTKEAGGWSIWMGLMLGLLMYIIIAITAINIGSRIIPTRQEDGAEFFMGANPIDPRQFYLENMLAGLLVIVAMMIPGYLIVLIQTLMNGAAEVIGDITLAFGAFIIIAYFFLSLTSVVTTSMFQRGLARGFGFGYVFYGMIMELFADNPDANLKEAANLSVNYYAGIVSILTADSYDWDPLLVITIISTVFVIIGVLMVKRPHYLEKATAQERFSVVDATTGYFVKPTSRFSQRFPLVAEQLRKDKQAMFVLITVFFFYFPVLLGTFNSLGAEIGDLAGTFNTPSTAMMIQGRTIEPTILGYGILKFYSVNWLWFGIYGTLVAASIPTREVRTNSQDIIYGTSTKPGRLMDSRVIAMLMEFTVIVWLAFTLMTSITYSFGDEFIADYTTADIQFIYFFTIWIHYSAIFITIVAIAMIPTEVSNGRKYGIGFFAISLLLSWIPYASESAEFLKYFSIFDYYSPVAILYGEVGFIEAIYRSVIILTLSIGFYILIRKKRYEQNSIY